MLQWSELVSTPFRADLDAWSAMGLKPAGKVGSMLYLFRYNGLRATLMHRLAHWAYRKRVPGLPMLLSNLNVVLHSIEIVPGVSVGPGLYMPHTVGTVIDAHQIGSNVTIQANVTLGLRREPRFPTIGDGVTLGVGCRVLGPITVGAGATVGANSVVLEDVPEGATVVGIPARLIRRSDGSAPVAE